MVKGEHSEEVYSDYVSSHSQKRFIAYKGRNVVVLTKYGINIAGYANGLQDSEGGFWLDPISSIREIEEISDLLRQENDIPDDAKITY